MSDLKDRLLKEIHAGNVGMTPRVYFSFKVAALAVVSVAIVAVTVFIFNFIFFSIRIGNETALLSFGPQGVRAFLTFFPWLLLILDIALIAVLQWLLRYFRFGYRVPILHLLAVLLVASLAFGFVLDRAQFNEALQERREHLPPPMRGFYDDAHRPHPRGSGICRCTILAIEGNVITVEDIRNATTTLEIILPMDDRRATTTGLRVGDIVFIAGREDDGVIEAFGVRKEGGGPPRGPMPEMMELEP